MSGREGAQAICLNRPAFGSPRHLSSTEEKTRWREGRGQGSKRVRETETERKRNKDAEIKAGQAPASVVSVW